MTEQDERNPSIEERAVQHHVNWWYLPEEGSKYANRWEKLQSNVLDRETYAVNELVRQAVVEAFLAGVALRLTGE